MRTKRGVRVTTGKIGGCNRNLKTFGIDRRRPITLIHISTTNPFRARRNPDLIATAVVADGNSRRMRAVSAIVTRCDCVRAAASAIEALIAQVSSPVRWEAVVQRLASEGVTTYVEVGPGTVLSGLVKKIHREATVVSFGAPEDLGEI